MKTQKQGITLVMGAISAKKSNMDILFKKRGMDKVEYVDYERCKNFDVEKLYDNTKITNIILGPMPHKMKGNKGYSSFIERIKRESEHFPKFAIAVANSSLKISISSLETALDTLVMA